MKTRDVTFYVYNFGVGHAFEKHDVAPCQRTVWCMFSRWVLLLAATATVAHTHSSVDTYAERSRILVDVATCCGNQLGSLDGMDAILLEY